MNISRHSLIFGLSYALDIAGKNNLSHSKSTAYLSVLIGRQLGCCPERALAFYYAALLHDIGISNEYDLYGHCNIGAEMLKKLPLPEEIPDYVLYHHEFYDGSGPLGRKADETPKGAQIIAFASCFDDTFGKNQAVYDRALFLAVKDWIEDSKSLFAKEILGAFEELTERESFLLDYFNHETKYELSKKLGFYDDVYYGYGDVLKFALCFADIIDRRSSFTYTHSKGIAELAEKAAMYLGYDGDTRNRMYIAGLLHDIGKLHVSTGILHKNGSLTPDERFEINTHTYYTRKILEQVEGFGEIVEYASNHHEKVDGTGYPYRLAGSDLSELEKVMAVCDVYQALTEERPYRTGLPKQKVWDIMDDMASKGHLDMGLTQKLKEIF